MKKNIYKSAAVLMLVLLFLIDFPDITYAKNASGAAAFDDLKWEKILEKSVATENGVVQAICATDTYIICMENSGDTSDQNDIVYAYYKNNVDENGNPVEQYSLALKNANWDWEHCNGMCYNADTDEIYVALYTNNNPDARGCVYVMDPHTLDFKRSIKIADDYNILGIGYYPEKGRYMIQANSEGDYGIKILDGNFYKLADFGAGDLGLGSNSQDMCVCGDYIMNFPLTFNQTGVGSYMNVYVIDDGGENAPDDNPFQFKLLKEVQMDLGDIDSTKVEPESICEVEDGVFVATVNIMTSSGKRKYAWYKTKLNGYYYNVKTECVNGTISESAEILKDNSYTVNYEPNEGYELSSVTVDGLAVDPKQYPASYTFSSVTDDHKITVEYIEKAVSTGSQSSGSGDEPAVQKQDQTKSVVIKIILILIPVLLALILGIRRYRQYLRSERRKKYLRKKIRKEKEHIAIQNAMEKEDDSSENISIESLLREIEELEHGGKTEGKARISDKTGEDQIRKE